MRIPSRRYHWETKHGVRDAKGKKIANDFSAIETLDRNQIAWVIGEMPSPRCSSWFSYIEHRLNMMNMGIETYTCRSYARLSLDKHIESHRTLAQIAAKLVNHASAIIFLGASGSTSPNSPIRIKKHIRCPGTRKLIGAFNNRGNCVIRMVDEYMTSQHCARCLKRFDIRTRSHRFKKCLDCLPNAIVRLPTLIVTNVSKRKMQMKKAIISVWRDMAMMGDAIAAALTQQQSTGRLVSKKKRFLKTWQPTADLNVDVENGAQSLTTVWHRDIVAAKLILYKGVY